MGLAYSMRSRTGVTAALSRMAEATEIEFDQAVYDCLPDDHFWKLVQRLFDRILHVVTVVVKEELSC